MLGQVGRVRIGTSGWRYPEWRGRFYPTGLPQRCELAYLAQRVNSVEINGSFYSLQRPEWYRAWSVETPDDFVFAVKGSRFITHLRQLREVRTPMANFFASGVLALEHKLGPVIWQLPPHMRCDLTRLAEFVALLPSTTGQAARLATEHDDRLAGRSVTTTGLDRPLRHAIEPRHESFRDPAFRALLADARVALVISDAAGAWPVFDDVTTDLAYVRLHGSDELYTSRYTPSALDGWAARIREWHASGLDVYVYFDNDAEGHAPFDAVALLDRVSDLL